jgi:SusD family.
MKRIIYILLLSVFFLSGCKNFLIEEPRLLQSTDVTLSNLNGLDKAVAGAYSPLADGTWYGAYLVLNSEMRSGNAMKPTVSTFNSGRMQTPYSMSYEPSSTEGLWTYAYYTISAVNSVITKIDSDMASLTVNGITKQDVNNIKAEALFLRALSHFDLLRVYCRTNGASPELGVPIIITPQQPTDMPARATVAETFDQIIKDLTDAESLMSDGYSREGVTDENAVANKQVIQALLSRVYLYNKQYQKAADYATKVIGSKKYSLWSAEEYPTVWSADVHDSGEVIFEIYGKKANAYDEYWEGPSHMTNPVGYGDCAASDQLIAIFDEGDVRGTKGVRGTDDGKVMFATDAEGASLGQYWTMKYMGKGEGDATNTPDVNNVIVLRLSEMYLIRAEAALNGATGCDALADVNAIRANRGVSPLTSVSKELVALERRKELNFEGHYWFDLARTTCILSYKDAAVTRELAPDSKYWAMPISKNQIDLNANLVQNQGY